MVMKDPGLEMLQFIYSIPPSVNPYEATAEHVRKLGRGGRPVLWGRIVRRIICCMFIILIGQAITVLWLRSRGNKLRFFRFNKLGLFHVELLNEVVLLMLLYSVCAFSDLLTQDLVQSIESMMNLTSLGARARTGASIRLSPLKRFALNGLLVAVIAVPGAIILWISIATSIFLREVETTSDQVVQALHRAARTYRPETYSSLQLLQLLTPTDGFHARSRHVIDNIKIMMLVYTGQHCLIAALYIPTSIILLRSLRQQSLSTGTLVTKGSTSSGTTVSDRSNPLLQVRRRLINQAYLIHLEELLHLPPIIYLFIGIQGTAYYADPTWILIDEIAIHGPAAIIGSIILAFSIQNTLYTTRAEQKSSEKRIEPEPIKAHVNEIIRLQDTKSMSTFQPDSAKRILMMALIPESGWPKNAGVDLDDAAAKPNLTCHQSIITLIIE
ncbi:hypothetical protein PCANC_11848 [Puccinia coronata f. sp. avenae]|uniref:Uncharacterized protein n=1 Tax=Puccinia coronata f. sp. avenae TaxID=200324 RepID=A0A2N5SUZ7_9BASI|nr:hypothetical protein PCANC_11848 [Puccinia coronata f. sp. avenae]